jgi:preprotein translocase subunit SecA
MLKNFVKLFSGDPTKKTVAQFGELAVQVNALEAEYEALSDDALCAKTDEFKVRIASALPSPVRRAPSASLQGGYARDGGEVGEV